LPAAPGETSRGLSAVVAVTHRLDCPGPIKTQAGTQPESLRPAGASVKVARHIRSILLIGRPMPHDGAIIFGDLVGKLDVLEVACDKCGRKGRYAVARLIEQRGRDAKVVDFLADITADCRKIATPKSAFR